MKNNRIRKTTRRVGQAGGKVMTYLQPEALQIRKGLPDRIYSSLVSRFLVKYHENPTEAESWLNTREKREKG